MQWDDLRYVLAIARSGSALRAAQALDVNQTTVLRRLDAIEAAAGTPLFERRRSGLQPTDVGRLATETAERIEREALGFEEALAATRRTLAGSARLTTSEGLAHRFVAPAMRAFHTLYPGILVELIAADERLDIARGEADIALRGGSRPAGAGVVARRLPDLDWTIYCSRSYAADRGAPKDRAAICGHEIVGLEGQMARLPGWRWLTASAPDTVFRFRSNSLTNLVSNLKAGLGLGALPVLTGDAEPDLVRCFPPPPELRAEFWLIVREAIKDQPHIRALTEFLASYVHDTMAKGIRSS